MPVRLTACIALHSGARLSQIAMALTDCLTNPATDDKERCRKAQDVELPKKFRQDATLAAKKITKDRNKDRKKTSKQDSKTSRKTDTMRCKKKVRRRAAKKAAKRGTRGQTSYQ